MNKKRPRNSFGNVRRAGAFLRRLIGGPRNRRLDGAALDAAPLASEADFAPEQGRLLTEVFANFAGLRRYRLYVPSAYRGQQLPLIVMLHGCKQGPDDFAAGTAMNFIAEEEGCFVAYPSQPKSANGMRCWNWFNTRNQHRGRGEPSLIAGITRQIIGAYNIDPERIYIAGLSAGGALTAIMAATYPDLYAAAGVHSGLARGAARNVPAAYAAMRGGGAEIAPEVTLSPFSLSNRRHVPTIIFHGDADDTVHPRNSDQVLDQARPGARALLRPNRTRRRVKGGHSYTRTKYIDERGRSVLELWVVHGSGHGWSGGNPAGSYTDPKGPDASREMMRFFLSHRLKRAKVEEEAAQ